MLLVSAYTAAIMTSHSMLHQLHFYFFDAAKFTKNWISGLESKGKKFGVVEEWKSGLESTRHEFAQSLNLQGLIFEGSLNPQGPE